MADTPLAELEARIRRLQLILFGEDATSRKPNNITNSKGIDSNVAAKLNSIVRDFENISNDFAISDFLSKRMLLIFINVSVEKIQKISQSLNAQVDVSGKRRLKSLNFEINLLVY